MINTAPKARNTGRTAIQPSGRPVERHPVAHSEPALPSMQRALAQPATAVDHAALLLLASSQRQPHTPSPQVVRQAQNFIREQRTQGNHPPFHNGLNPRTNRRRQNANRLHERATAHNYKRNAVRQMTGWLADNPNVNNILSMVIPIALSHDPNLASGPDTQPLALLTYRKTGLDQTVHTAQGVHCHLTRIPRHPDWRGADPVFKHVQGHDAIVIGSAKSRLVQVVLVIDPEIRNNLEGVTTFPKGEPQAVADLLHAYQANPIWLDATGTG